MAVFQSIIILFVWYNTNSQVVSTGEQIGVPFNAGQTPTFTGAYGVPGTHKVEVFITDANFNALSAAYSAAVTV